MSILFATPPFPDFKNSVDFVTLHLIFNLEAIDNTFPIHNVFGFPLDIFWALSMASYGT